MASPGKKVQRELERQLAETKKELKLANERLAEVSSKLETAALRDPLTGLYNHRAAYERLTEEVARAGRYDQPLALLLCHFDTLSSINAHQGYTAGDGALSMIASAVFSSESLAIRKSDVAARYSGGVFALLLPETDLEGAEHKAERIRLAMADLAIGSVTLTASVGVSCFPEHGDTADALLAAAESALREARAAGDHRVIVADRAGENASEKAPAPAEPEIFSSYHQRMSDIVAALEREQAIAALYVDLSQLGRIEQEYGVARHSEVFAQAGNVLRSLVGSRLRRDDIICRSEVDDAYVCILSPARNKSSESENLLPTIAKRIEEILVAELASALSHHGCGRPRITVGYSRVLNNPLVRVERLVARLLDEARYSAAMLRERTLHHDKDSLQDLILHKQLIAVYQPIVHLESGDTFGFESLTRGPKGGRLEMPSNLFAVADEVDLTFELDRACFRNALRNAAGLEPVHRLFVNILPLSFYDAKFIETEVSRLLEAASLTPANLVFEITEKLAIENFSAFRTALARYTAMGFGVAIDDVGTRHSNLEAVMALRPHFIKVSDILVTGISGSTVKREMMRSLGRIAAAIDAVIVAEGIEEPEDLAVLGDLGVRYGQGFFLARPGAPFPTLPDTLKAQVTALVSGEYSPIPEPQRDLDDAGDYLDSATIGVSEAVGERIRSVEESSTEDDSAAPAGERRRKTRPETRQFWLPNEGVDRWQPIAEDELGTATSGDGPSLLRTLVPKTGPAADEDSGNS